MAAGIPVLMLPLKGNQEHERLAVDLGVHEAGIAIREEDLTEENLTPAIQTLLMNEDYRRTIVSNGLQLVPRSGLDDVVKLLIQTPTRVNSR